MANKDLASASFSRVQRKLQTTEEVLAALLDSEDDSDAVDSYLSDDSSICFDSNADNKDSDTGWQNISDRAEPCFKDSRFISDVRSNTIILTLSRDMCCFRGIWLYEIKLCLLKENGFFARGHFQPYISADYTSCKVFDTLVLKFVT